MKQETERKYFHAIEDGCVTYWLVAASMSDALRMLADHELEGEEITIDEVEETKAATITVHDGDPSVKLALSAAEVGAVFCSEW